MGFWKKRQQGSHCCTATSSAHSKRLRHLMSQCDDFALALIWPFWPCKIQIPLLLLLLSFVLTSVFSSASSQNWYDKEQRSRVRLLLLLCRWLLLLSTSMTLPLLPTAKRTSVLVSVTQFIHRFLVAKSACLPTPPLPFLSNSSRWRLDYMNAVARTYCTESMTKIGCGLYSAQTNRQTNKQTSLYYI